MNMKTKMYVITYDFRDPDSGKHWSGVYFTDSLICVGAFYAMVERYSGWCRCPIG